MVTGHNDVLPAIHGTYQRGDVLPARRNQKYPGKLQPRVLKMMTNRGVNLPRPMPPMPKGVALGNTRNICTAEGNNPAHQGIRSLTLRQLQ